jgi:GNAT superfamily N-acetyltransferase
VTWIDERKMRIREAWPEEALLLATVQERASVAALAHVFPPELYPYPSEAIRARWAEAVADPLKRVLIALREDEPAGAACVSDAWLEGLYVLPEQWGKGLADTLMTGRSRSCAGSAPRVVASGCWKTTLERGASTSAVDGGERRDARRPLSAESARRGLHPRLLDWAAT